jgi:hypothetical protein
VGFDQLNNVGPTMGQPQTWSGRRSIGVRNVSLVSYKRPL